MNRNQNKRQRNPPKYGGKRQKISPTDIEETPEVELLNTPVTPTTVHVLHKKLIHLKERRSATLKNDGMNLTKPLSEEINYDGTLSNLKDQQSKSRKCTFQRVQGGSQSSGGNRAQDLNSDGNIINIHSDSFYFSHSSARTHTKSKILNVSNMDKYSPKNIKSPSPTSSKSRTYKSKKLLNKNNNYPPVNISFPSCSTSTASESNKCSTGNIELPPHCLNSYLENRSVIKTTTYKRQQTKEDIISTPSIDFSRIATEKRKCEKCGEEEMLLFFWRMLPVTAALSEEKKNEFKATVISVLKQLSDK